MAGTRSRPMSEASVSTASGLMQDVPGAFPSQSRPAADDDVTEERTKPQSLSQAVYARRAEYVRPRHVRIKVGSWNVAAMKGTVKDVGGWFVGGKGVSERLSGMTIDGEDGAEREDVAEQEARYVRKEGTLPKHDPGSVPGNDEVGLYVLGLQEVVDVGSATEALRPYTDPSVATKWKAAMDQALPTGYRLVAEQQLIGLLVLVYASGTVASDVKSVSTTSVGTGLMGYMGNKGAVTVRIVLGETTRLVFVNCHLAAGADKTALERRNWDTQQIISRTRFEPIQDAMDLSQTSGEQIGDEDFAFWCGDLNYRISGIPGDDVRRLLMLHTRNEYDVSQPSAQKIEKEVQEATESIKKRVGPENSSGSSLRSIPTKRTSGDSRHSMGSTRPSTIIDEIEASEDPTSLQTTLTSLLPHDELHQQMRTRKAFHDGWREGPVNFLPTYKYDAGTVGVFDSSEKKRAPSWCDRILFRTRRDRLAYQAQIRDEDRARSKDAEMRANGTDQAASDEDILYDYDPDTDGVEPGLGDEYDEEYDDVEDGNDGMVITKEGFEDEMELEYYTAHQRVLSSDHKPLDAVFLLKYDAVIPELKAKVHAEVARELDKAENEGRPDVTVVVDAHHSSHANQSTPETNNHQCLPENFEGVWFGDIRWAQSKHRSLTIANTSRVPAKFSFIERPADEQQQPGIAPDWLHLKVNGVAVSSSETSSQAVSLEPGETCVVELELRIFSLDDVKTFNDSKQDLEDILVLRVENGRDHFCPIRANWLESSLGRSIDKLVRIPEGGIRKLQRQRPGSSKVAAKKGGPSSAENDSPRSSWSSSKSGGGKSPVQPTTEGDELPVRFSAPRELFRLTEAVESLSAHFLAEWEMTHPPAPVEPRMSSESIHPSAPWDDHPAWPFDAACWAERSTAHWPDALSSACAALDEDRLLEPSLPPDLPRLQRLYILCDLLLLFLRSMPDGIIPSDLWMKIETYLSDTEKAKRKPALEDQRTAVQEVLAQRPGHNISFILITSMLERLLGEISAATSRRQTAEPETSAEPLSPARRAGGTLRRMTQLGRVPQVSPASRRALAVKALAGVFAEVMVRTPTVGAAGEKAKIAMERRKAEVLEVFVKGEEGGQK